MATPLSQDLCYPLSRVSGSAAEQSPDLTAGSSLSLHSLSCSLHICRRGLHLREDLSGCPSANGVREALRLEKQPREGWLVAVCGLL